MPPFCQSAQRVLARDANFVVLAGFMLMFAFSFAPPIAFNCAATVALMFSVGLIWRAFRLTEDHVEQLEVWRRLDPDARPVGRAGRLWACNHFEALLLRTAKSSAVFAISLYSLALFTAALV